MSIFNLFGTKKQQNPMPARSTETTNSSCKTKVSLEKSKISLEKTIEKLSETPKGKLLRKIPSTSVVWVDDGSGSMQEEFEKGRVQDVITRILPLALKFDDNKALDVYTFSTGAKRLTPMTEKNYHEYVEKCMIKHVEFSGTNYAPVIKMLLEDYPKPKSPVFVIFRTDGENWDQSETDKIIRKTSDPENKMFILFIGMGDSSFNYLEKLDNLSGRKMDNTAFIRVADFDKISDEMLYEKMLEQFIPWLEQMGY